MTPTLPDGDPAPTDGALPEFVADGATGRAFGVYLHVPFCSVRCGYCDFNTYTATELGGGASQSSYADTARAEIELAARVMDRAGIPRRPVSTVFLGGGTPTILPTGHLAMLLSAMDEAWGLAQGAEVTVEANPDSVTPSTLNELARAGFTRVSFGMQSAVPSVLATLDRTHDPARLPDVVAAARAAGLAVSLDLIYGTPGESTDDWRRSVDAALALHPDHLSAYALTVEPGTRLAARVRRGELPAPDGDDQAAKYEIADVAFAAADYDWYEVSNWAVRTDEGQRCRHNLGYWRSDDWWGIGPGAHSHLGGDRSVRWWNVKHPRAYAERLAVGASPAAGRELLDPQTTAFEDVMLRVRLVEGLPVSRLGPSGRDEVPALIADGLIDGRVAVAQNRLVLTRRGRLLADGVVRRLVG